MVRISDWLFKEGLKFWKEFLLLKSHHGHGTTHFIKKGIFCSTNALCGVEYSKMAVKLLLATQTGLVLHVETFMIDK